MTEEPLVSVCIVTYNSAEFIIEALDSVAAQTYKNIELIVSDDASTDNTVELCRDWIANNEQKFSRSELVVVEKNTGVSANFNRAIRNSGGFYIKGLAGDDKLLPNCISDNVSYMMLRPETDLLFSDEIIFSQNEDGKRISSRLVYFEHLNKREFKTHLLIRNFLPAPAYFMKRSIYERLGGYDESIPMMEDKPFFIKVLFANSNMAYMPKATVCYRINNQSLSQADKKLPGAVKLENSRELAANMILNYSCKISKLLWAYQKVEFDCRFNPSIINKLKRLLRFLNPYYYYINYIFFKIRIFSYFSNDRLRLS